MDLYENAYRPNENEAYMNPNQLKYFYNKLTAMQIRLSEKLRETLMELREKESRQSDVLDRSDAIMTRTLKLRTCQHYQGLIEQHESALRRIREGTYGYCVMTGQEIGLDRLEALPYACLSIEAQVRREH